MPLDPSIFTQYAQLNAQNNAQVLGQLTNAIQGFKEQNRYNQQMKLEKQKLENQGLDLDKLATPALIKMQMGEQLTPQETAVLKAWDLTETRKLAPDATGNYRKVNASIFDTAPQGFDLGVIAPVAPVTSAPLPDTFAGGVAPMGAISDAQFDAIPASPLPVSGGPLNVGMLQPTGDPAMDAYLAKMFEQNGAMQDNLPAVPAGGFDTSLVAPERTPITVPPELAGNPNAAQKYLESAASAQAQIPSDVKKAADMEEAKKRAENKVNSELQISSVDSAISALDTMANDLNDAPSGVLEGLAAKATNLAGVPTKAAKTQARYESRVPLLAAKLKKFIRDPGEGNFTDADQKNLMMMMPADNDSVEVKYEKLMAVGEELKRLKEEKTGVARKKPPESRGFKYLGTE